MTTPNEKEKVDSTPIVDPFPKPNTIPSGWDVSAFKTKPVSSPTETYKAGSQDSDASK